MRANAREIHGLAVCVGVTQVAATQHEACSFSCVRSAAPETNMQDPVDLGDQCKANHGYKELGRVDYGVR